jgi:ABC-type branched-subunit amino acid transport system ATPase component
VSAPVQLKDPDLAESNDAHREPVLAVSGVRRYYGGVQALDGVDLELPAGAIHGLIGPNGAGKSTFFNVVTGVVAPDQGEVRFKGRDVTGRPLDELARAGMARTFQSPRGFASMSVIESLLFVPPSPAERLGRALLRGGRRSKAVEARAEQVLERMGLQHARNERCDQLTGGEMRLLEIARHLMRDIDMLLLDEPTAGVIPTMQARIASAIKDLAAQGIAVLVVEHNLKFVFELASEVAVLVKGRVIASGPPAEIQQNPDVVAAYLGSDEG